MGPAFLSTQVTARGLSVCLSVGVAGCLGSSSHGGRSTPFDCVCSCVPCTGEPKWKDSEQIGTAVVTYAPENNSRN